jgi:hypothetical protein
MRLISLASSPGQVYNHRAVSVGILYESAPNRAPATSMEALELLLGPFYVDSLRLIKEQQEAVCECGTYILTMNCQERLGILSENSPEGGHL